MKKLALFMIISVFATAALAGVAGSKHDLRATGTGTPIGTGLTEICVVCHTPHQGSVNMPPLWNHAASLAGTTYTMYSNTSSPSYDATNIAIVATGTSVTNMCLSCHDGTVSVLDMRNPPNGATITPAALANYTAGVMQNTAPGYVGTDLTNDHPVSFTYNAALVTLDSHGGAAQLNDPTSATVSPLLFAGSTVQCASCHDAHNSVAGTPMLVMANTGSALCLTCHIK